jgi:hypothetical protein
MGLAGPNMPVIGPAPQCRTCFAEKAITVSSRLERVPNWLHHLERQPCQAAQIFLSG